jgi:threonine/homoserine/homoserine lactone efflux protein
MTSRLLIQSPQDRSRGDYLLGLIFALSSPWNIGFWLAVVGSQQAMTHPRSIGDSLSLACAVVSGAIAWTIVLRAAVRFGADIFARPGWQVWTQLLTAAVMIHFGIRLALQMFA